MAEPYLIDTVRIKTMNDQLWRRVGVTQSFEILLVEAALLGPGVANEVARRASSKLSGGAARFWDLSIAQLQKDLCRRRVLVLSDGILQAHSDFASKLDKVLSDHESAVSRSCQRRCNDGAVSRSRSKPKRRPTRRVRRAEARKPSQRRPERVRDH